MKSQAGPQKFIHNFLKMLNQENYGNIYELNFLLILNSKSNISFKGLPNFDCPSWNSFKLNYSNLVLTNLLQTHIQSLEYLPIENPWKEWQQYMPIVNRVHIGNRLDKLKCRFSSFLSNPLILGNEIKVMVVRSDTFDHALIQKVLQN